MLEISDIRRKGIELSMKRRNKLEAKTKTLISCAVTAQLICVFVFTYVKIRFSHVAQIRAAAQENQQSACAITKAQISLIRDFSDVLKSFDNY